MQVSYIDYILMHFVCKGAEGMCVAEIVPLCLSVTTVMLREMIKRLST
jgi:hypothetical protein